MTTNTIARPILLVEDNPDDVELTRLGLERHKLANRLVVARDGVDALELLLGKDARRFAFVMLDLKLPKLNGFDVLKALREDPRTVDVPVIILTSSTQQEDLVESYDSGANSYVRKPVDFGEFANAVATLGLYWAAVNELPE